jgi:phosphatidate cytidylyltransferase
MPKDERPDEGEERNHPMSDRDPSDGVRIVGEDGEPPLRLSDDTGPLPHWTEPPTGEVPRIFLEESSSDDINSWSGLANQQPVWRDDREGRDERLDVAGPDDSGARPRPNVGPIADDAESAAEAARVTAIRTTRVGERAVPRGRAETPRPMMAPAGLGTDLPLRVAVGAGLLVAFGILYAFGPAYVMVLVVAALVVAAFEFYDTLRQKGYHPANLVGVAAVAGLPIAIYNRGIIAIPLVLFLAFVATAAWYLTSGGLETQPLPSSAATLFGIVYVGVLGSHAALLLQPAGQDQGKAIFLFAVVLTVACDAGSYFGGSVAGRTPLVDWVSPNKTVEGLVVGWVTTVLAGLIIKIFGVSIWGDVSLIKVLVMSVVIAVAATLGDLTESMIKRNLGVKDFGSFLPGHGGILDRCDGFLISLPAAYFGSIALHIPPFG